MAATVVIIDRDAGSRQLLKATLSGIQQMEVLAETDSLVYGYELVRNNRPSIVFIDLEPSSEKSLEMVEKIATYFKETLIVVSGETLDMERLMACMQAGAREFIQRPFTPDEIQRVIEKHRKEFVVNTEGDKTGRIITVFSNKGGLGKTTIAVNLALALSEVIQKPTALVDLNLQLGDVTTFLDISPKQTIVDIAKNVSRVDAAYLESSLADYHNEKARTFVLADPLSVEDAEEISAEEISTVLTILKATYDYVIIDTNTSFDSKTLMALDLADQILLVSMVNLPSIRSTQRVLTLFERLGYDKQKVKLVLNRFVPDDDITVEDVEETLEQDVFWKIPNQYQAVMSAINRGVPIMQMEHNEPIYSNFLDLAHLISGVVRRDQQWQTELMASGQTTGRASQKSLLGQIFGRK